jgi:hypothetical protein
MNKVIDTSAGVCHLFCSGVHSEELSFIYTNTQCMNPSKAYFFLETGKDMIVNSRYNSNTSFDVIKKTIPI